MEDRDWKENYHKFKEDWQYGFLYCQSCRKKYGVLAQHETNSGLTPDLISDYLTSLCIECWNNDREYHGEGGED